MTSLALMPNSRMPMLPNNGKNNQFYQTMSLTRTTIVQKENTTKLPHINSLDAREKAVKQLPDLELTYKEDDMIDVELIRSQRIVLQNIVQTLNLSKPSASLITFNVESSNGLIQTFHMPISSISISHTMLQIVNHSSQFKEGGKVISFPQIDASTMSCIVEFMQRKYLCSAQVDISPLDSFKIPMEEILLVLDAANYLQIEELVSICIERLALNFERVQSLAHLSPEIISRLLKKISIGDIIIFFHTDKAASIFLDEAEIWKHVYWKLQQSNLKCLAHIDRSKLSNCAKDLCTSFYVEQSCQRFPAKTLRVIEYQGFCITSLQICFFSTSSDFWEFFFSMLPNLKTCSLILNDTYTGIENVLCKLRIPVKIVLPGIKSFTQKSSQLISTFLKREEMKPNKKLKPQIHFFKETELKIGKEKTQIVQNKRQVSVEVAFAEYRSDGRLMDDFFAHLNVCRQILPHLTQLDFTNQNLGLQGAAFLAEAFNTLGKACTVKSLILRNTKITAGGVKVILESLIIWHHHQDLGDRVSPWSPCNELEKLDLSMTICEEDKDISEAYKLMSHLFMHKVFPKLKVFNFSQNAYDSLGQSAFIEAIENIPVSILGLSGMGFISQCVRQLADLSKKNLFELDISSCQILPRKFTNFFNALKNIKVLDISDNILDALAMDSLAKWIATSNLEKLLLNGNGKPQSHEWVVKLLTGIQFVKKLTEIHICNQGLDDRFCNLISKHKSNVIYWNISWNLISNIGLEELSKIRTSKTITFELRNNGLKRIPQNSSNVLILI
jgi:hypothetical protein